MIDRVVADLGRKLVEVPVGFKWFVDGLFGRQPGLAAKKAPGPRSSASTRPAVVDRQRRYHHMPAGG